MNSENVSRRDFTRSPLCSRVDERVQINGASRAVRNRGDDRCADATIAFIKRQGSQPWVAYAGLHMPHPPYVALEQYFNYYLNRVDVPNVPPGYLEDLHFVYQQMRHFKNIATPSRTRKETAPDRS